MSNYIHTKSTGMDPDFFKGGFCPGACSSLAILSSCNKYIFTPQQYFSVKILSFKYLEMQLKPLI